MTIRPLKADDAAELAALYAANREFLARFEPPHSDEFFTPEGQRGRIERAIAEGVSLERAHPFAILDGDAIAGTVAIFHVRRGSAQSCSIGFWVDRARNGRGLATSAVEDAVAYAFSKLKLSRVWAATFADNVAAHRVLGKASFERIDRAGPSVRLNGEVRDFVLFQRVAGPWVPSRPWRSARSNLRTRQSSPRSTP